MSEMDPHFRERALLNYYTAERRAGADPLTANERMHEFAKRLDAINEGNLEALKTIVREHTS